MATIASLVIAPPARPRSQPKTNQSNKKYFTIHSKPNNAFTLRVTEQARTAIVGFNSIDDAFFVSQMIETYFVHQKEWPETNKVGPLILPNSQVGDVLQYVYIQQWNFDDLKILCTKNILDMISVETIQIRKTGYSFTGNSYSFTAPIEFYKERFTELLTATSSEDA